MIREEQKDLWHSDFDSYWRGTTVNGTVNSHGQAVMGAGCALEAAHRYPWLSFRYGQRLQLFDFGVCLIVEAKLILFPTKRHPREDSRISLIRQSCKEVRTLFEGTEIKIVLPRPGCGYGNLDWRTVKPVLEVEFEGMRNEIVVVWQ